MAPESSISRKEFLFAIDCLNAVLTDGSLRWKPRVSPGRCKREKNLCTENIVAAVRCLASGRLSKTTEYFFDFWFNSTQNRSTPATFKELAELITSGFCLESLSPKEFLEFCATIAELAALAYVKKDSGAPDYAILCIYQVLCYYKASFTKTVWKTVDKCASDIIAEFKKRLPKDGDVTCKQSDKVGANTTRGSEKDIVNQSKGDIDDENKNRKLEADINRKNGDGDDENGKPKSGKESAKKKRTYEDDEDKKLRNDDDDKCKKRKNDSDNENEKPRIDSDEECKKPLSASDEVQKPQSG